MAFSTFEMRLVGVIAQQGGSYARSLVGEMRRRTYNDPRLGLIDTVGGTEWRMSVVLTAAPLPAGAAPQVAQFCGTIAGCGTVDSALAVGGLIVRGSDDSVRFDAMCANMTGTAHCIDSTNPYLPTMDADSARVRAVLTSAGATGPPPTDSERTTSYDGARGPDAAGGAPAQWGRYCERAARDDSIARANAPVPLGTTPPVVTLDSTRLAACHAGNTNAFLPLTSGP